MVIQFVSVNVFQLNSPPVRRALAESEEELKSLLMKVKVESHLEMTSKKKIQQRQKFSNKHEYIQVINGVILSAA